MVGESARIISQRRLGSGPVFRFNESHLEYFGRDWDFQAKYEDIAGPGQHKRAQTSDRVTTIVFIYLLLVGLLLLRSGHYPKYGVEALRGVGTFMAGLLGVFVAVCGPLYYLTHRAYTVVPARNGNIMVVRDRHHDEIVQTLRAARLKALRALSAPDLANSPAEELAKFKWLYDEGAITEEEYSQLCARMST